MEGSGRASFPTPRPAAWTLSLQAPEHSLSRAELSIFPQLGPSPDFLTKLRFSEIMELPLDVWATQREKPPCAHSPLALPHVPGALKPTSLVCQGIPDDKTTAFYRHVSATTVPPGRCGSRSHGAYYGLAMHPRGCPSRSGSVSTGTHVLLLLSTAPWSPPLHGLPAPTPVWPPPAPPAPHEHEATSDITDSLPGSPVTAAAASSSTRSAQSLHGLPGVHRTASLFFSLLPCRIWPLAPFSLSPITYCKLLPP